MTTITDNLWLWAHDAGSHNSGWGLPGSSRITPTEAAIYMGIPNLIMVRYEGRPPLPFDQYAVPFRALKQVVWSVVGARGESDQEERKHVLELAARNRNITGVMMDDFFAGAPGNGSGNALSLDQLPELRGELTARHLDLWAVLYDSQLDKPLDEYLDLLDKLSFWTWDSDKLKDLENNLEKLPPKCGKVLGCYMWDYSKKKPMPLDLMKHQCEVGLRWLSDGRIEGMIFLASCICDLDLEAVEWVTEWIREVSR